MNKNLAKLCAELVYVVLSSVGALLSTHLFTTHIFSRDFYVYYTNLTNFFCLGIMIACFIRSYKACKNNIALKQSKTLDNLKFVATILISITFLVFNILLADFSLNNYFLNLYNLLYHVVLPIYFITYTFVTNIPKASYVYGDLALYYSAA